MTQDDLTERVLNVVGRPSSEDELLQLRARILGLTEDGVTEMSLEIAADMDRRQELRLVPPVAITVTDGEGSLATAIASPNRLLLKHLFEADVRDPDGRKLFYLSLSRYEMAQPVIYGYFTYEGTNFFARFAGEEVDESDGEVLISGNATPSLDEVSEALGPNLVGKVVRLLAATPERKRETKK